MMNAEAVVLIRKRSALVAQIRAERHALARQGAALRPVALKVDKVIASIRFIKRRPEALLLPITILALGRPQRLLGYAARGLALWRVVQRVRNQLRPAIKNNRQPSDYAS